MNLSAHECTCRTAPLELDPLNLTPCRHVAVSSRREALQLQEEAEAHSTATYRAPELFDIPTDSGPLDYAKVDVWAAGASLYHLMYGASPFQKAVDQAGGSIALAVLNCSVSWPLDERNRWVVPVSNAAFSSSVG